MANRATTATMVPGTDERDMAVALEYLIDDGAIEGPTWRLSTLVAMTEEGAMALTERGLTRVADDDI